MKKKTIFNFDFETKKKKKMILKGITMFIEEFDYGGAAVHTDVYDFEIDDRINTLRDLNAKIEESCTDPEDLYLWHTYAVPYDADIDDYYIMAEDEDFFNSICELYHNIMDWGEDYD